MRRVSGINPFIFILKLVDSNKKYISYDFETIYSLPCKLNLDLKFLISFYENIILFYFIKNIILFLFYFYFILFYFILFFLIFIFYLFILFYFIFFIKRNVY